jgi:hypothetical protein
MEAAVTKQTLQGFGGVLSVAKLQAKKSAWLLIFLAVIGLSFTACPDGNSNGNGGGGGNSALNGTWIGTRDGTLYGETKLYNGSFEFTSYSLEAVSEKGTYIATDTKITLTPTHIWGGNFSLEARVYSKNELLSALGITDEQLSQTYPWAFQAYSADYFPNEYKYVFESGTTYTKK